MNTSTKPARITVLGAGFGALSTVRELRQRDAHAQITLVAPRAELHYPVSYTHLTLPTNREV